METTDHTITLLYMLTGLSIALAVIISYLLVALRRSKERVRELEVTLDFHQMWTNSYLKKLGISSDSMN